MADKGIIFSAPMVRALLAGSKTQTRRLIKPQPLFLSGLGKRIYADQDWKKSWNGTCDDDLPYATGDRLYVRESYWQRGHWQPVPGQRTKAGQQKWAFVPADSVIRFDQPADFRLGRHHKDPATVIWHKRLGRFMPRELSRLWLNVTDVRVQRLQDISAADAMAEGIDSAAIAHFGDPVRAYAALWNSLHGAENEQSWEANPWIVAISFGVNRGNIDQFPATGEEGAAAGSDPASSGQPAQ